MALVLVPYSVGRIQECLGHLHVLPVRGLEVGGDVGFVGQDEEPEQPIQRHDP